MNASILASAIAPVILILALGFGAGKHHSFSADQASGLSQLALTYALPAALFLGMAQFNRGILIEQGPIAALMLFGYSGLYICLYSVLRLLRMGRLEAALLAYTFSSTAVPIYGLTVLSPIYGADVATGIVGLTALVTNITQVSLAVFMLHSGSADPGVAPLVPAHPAHAADVQAKSGASPSALATIAHSIANPLVWAPALGAFFALLGFPLSPYVATALKPLAVSSAGVAIFASGLILAAHRVKLTSPVVIVGCVISLVLQPALFFLAIKAAGLSGTMVQAAFVASSMPTGTPSVLFAQQYKTCEAETASIMLVSTLGMLAALPATIALSAYL